MVIWVIVIETGKSRFGKAHGQLKCGLEYIMNVIKGSM